MSHLGKVFKTKETAERSSREMEGDERISSSRGDEVVRAIGEHRLIICTSMDVRKPQWQVRITSMASDLARSKFA